MKLWTLDGVPLDLDWDACRRFLSLPCYIKEKKRCLICVPNSGHNMVVEDAVSNTGANLGSAMTTDIEAFPAPRSHCISSPFPPSSLCHEPKRGDE